MKGKNDISRRLNETVKNYFSNEIEGYVKELKGFVRLDLGESLEGPSPKVLKEIKKINLQELGEYPDSSNNQLKEAFAKFTGMKKENITVGAGSDGIIEDIARLFIDPEDSVIMTIPTFYRLEDVCSRAGAKIIFIPLDDLKFTEKTKDKIIQKIKEKRPKLVWICSPNNPTGQLVDKKMIEEIIQCSENSLVIIDEAYMGFTGEKDSNVKIVNKHPNVIVLRSMSKSLALASLRVGFGVSNPEIIRIMEKFRPTFPVNIVAQKLVPVLLSDKEYIEKVNEITKRRRKTFFQKFSEMDLDFIESSTNTVFVRHRNLDLYEELLKRKIAVADFRKCRGVEGKGYVRITIGKDKDNEKLFSALEDIAQSKESE
jgi:histidinol-phosphate aminotransferase